MDTELQCDFSTHVGGHSCKLSDLQSYHQMKINQEKLPFCMWQWTVRNDKPDSKQTWQAAFLKCEPIKPELIQERMKWRAESKDFTPYLPCCVLLYFCHWGHNSNWIGTSISPHSTSFLTAITFNITVQQPFATSCTFWRWTHFVGLVWESRRRTNTQRAGRDVKDQWKYFVQIWHSIFLYMRLCFVNAFVFLKCLFLKGIST